MNSESNMFEADQRPRWGDHYRNSVRARVRLGTMIMAFVASLMAIASLSIIWIFDNSHHEVETTAMALRNHVEGDMMHDAIRSSVLKAQLASLNDNDAEAEEAAADLDRYSRWFARLIDENKKLNLPPRTQLVLSRVDKPLKEYLADARQVQAALKNDSDTSSMLRGFEQKFDALEGAMLDVSDALEKELSASRDWNETLLVSSTIGLIALALLLIAAIGYFFRSVSQFVITPLEQYTQSLFALSRGEEDVRVSGETRNDEIGRLAMGIIAFRDTARAARQAGSAKLEAEDKAKAAVDLANSEAAKRAALQQLATTNRTARTGYCRNALRPGRQAALSCKQHRQFGKPHQIGNHGRLGDGYSDRRQHEPCCYRYQPAGYQFRQHRQGRA